MSLATTVVSFGEWLPDLADIGSQGLQVANNVLPDVDGYIPFTPYVPYTGFAHSSSPHTLPAQAAGMITVYDPVAAYYRFYAGGADGVLYMDIGGTGAFVARSATLTASKEWQFTPYGSLLVGVNGANTMYHTIGSATNFVTMNAPKAACAAMVGQFLMLGNLTDTSGTLRPYTLAWSAINDITNFPTPNSATAIATQSGEQTFKPEFGQINAVIGGDQFSLVFQQRAITRVTYVGPPAVFQFDELQRGRGATYLHGAIKAAGLTHYVADDGFYATDGVNVIPTGLGKIDETAMNSQPANVIGGFDQSKKCLYWNFAPQGFSLSSKLYAYHVDAHRWTSADATLRSMDQAQMGQFRGPFAFDENNILVSPMQATAGSYTLPAILTTFDSELNPAARAFVGGVKPNIEYTGTAPTITVRVGSRNDMGSSPTFTATTTPTTRTGIADVRVDAKYHRAEVQIVGQFTKATGLEFKATPSGEA